MTLRRRTFLVLAVLLFFVAPTLAAKPAEDLLRLVPHDAALCLIIQDIRGHTKQLAESPFLEKVRQSPLANLLPDQAGGVQLADFDKFLQSYLQTNLAELR